MIKTIWNKKEKLSIWTEGRAFLHLSDLYGLKLLRNTSNIRWGRDEKTKMKNDRNNEYKKKGPKGFPSAVLIWSDILPKRNNISEIFQEELLNPTGRPKLYQHFLKAFNLIKILSIPTSVQDVKVFLFYGKERWHICAYGTAAFLWVLLM